MPSIVDLTTSTVRSPGTLARKLIVAVVALAAVGLGVWLALPAAGRWLVVEDPLSPASACVVFGGQAPFRAMEAASIYEEGWVKEVWLTQGLPREEDEAFKALGISQTREHEYSHRVLLRLGVPEDAIRVLPGEMDNTEDEVRAVASQIAGGTTRLILVTSKFHTRRVKAIWRAVAPDRPVPILRYARRDPARPERWWRNSRDAQSVLHEWFGLLNAWIGFPIKSER